MTMRQRRMRFNRDNRVMTIRVRVSHWTHWTHWFMSLSPCDRDELASMAIRRALKIGAKAGRAV